MNFFTEFLFALNQILDMIFRIIRINIFNEYTDVNIFSNDAVSFHKNLYFML